VGQGLKTPGTHPPTPSTTASLPSLFSPNDTHPPFLDPQRHTPPTTPNTHIKQPASALNSPHTRTNACTAPRSDPRTHPTREWEEERRGS
jgi:hypothetical protein